MNPNNIKFTKKAIKDLVKEELWSKYLYKKGFKKWKYTFDDAFDAYKEVEVGKDIVMGILNTNYIILGEVKIEFGIAKIINVVEDILWKVNNKIKLNPPLRKDGYTFLIPTKSSLMKQINRELKSIKEIKEAIEFIKGELENKWFKELERFNDIREIDKIVNDLDDFWDDDWKKPYGLGGRFDLRRIIIAKLSGNPRYEELVERIYDFYDDLREKRGLPKDDRNDLSLAFNYTVHLLKGVKPLYDKYE